MPWKETTGVKERMHRTLKADTARPISISPHLGHFPNVKGPRHVTHVPGLNCYLSTRLSRRRMRS